ncbi:MAG: peptidylprolyl isomerase [Defluviitaleaceae bacterium]|nr:peptidylprolyl isomerase [Defluviitaleaceae bacterium]
MRNPIMSIKMRSGALIKIELFHDLCPNSINSIVHLAKKGLYNSRNFYRVVKDFLMMTDCNARNGFENGYDFAIDGEYAANGYEKELPPFTKGMVGMAGPYGGSSKISIASTFYIVTGENHRLNGNYSVIGRVIEGLDEVRRINNVKCRSARFTTELFDADFSIPEEPEVMETVTIETFGADYPPPKTVPYPEGQVEALKALREFLEIND